MADIKTLLGDEYKEGMTDAEIVTAIQKVEFPDMTQFVAKSDYEKLKNASDANASEAKKWKQSYHSTLSEAEQARIAAEEAQKATNDRLAELERKDKISTTKDEYLKSGFSPELALSTAEAFVDGNMSLVLQNINKHVADAKAAKQDEELKGTPAPPANGNPNPGKIDYSEKISEAQAQDDWATAAHYQRLQTQQK